MDDWRLRGQSNYLQGVKLTKQKYRAYREGWDHDHCEFCGVKFSETLKDCEKEGWVTENQYHWVCCACYEDFKDQFDWK